MSKCWVRGCTNNYKQKHLSFYSIPIVRLKQGEQIRQLSQERRKQWLENIGRTEKPWYKTRICSVHFIKGRPADLYDVYDPDWAPTLHMNPESEKEKNRSILIPDKLDGEGQHINFEISANHASKILKKLYCQFRERKNCDLEIKLKDGSIFAHKCLIEIFFLQVGLEFENDHFIMDLSEFEKDVVTSLLDMIYTGELTILPHRIHDVQYAATKVGYFQAKKKCNIYLDKYPSVIEYQNTNTSMTNVAKKKQELVDEHQPPLGDFPSNKQLQELTSNHSSTLAEPLIVSSDSSPSPVSKIEENPVMSSDSTSKIIYQIVEGQPDYLTKTAPKIANYNVQPSGDPVPIDIEVEPSPMVEENSKISSDSTSKIIYEIVEGQPDYLTKTAPKIANYNVQPSGDPVPIDIEVEPSPMVEENSKMSSDSTSKIILEIVEGQQDYIIKRAQKIADDKVPPSVDTAPASQAVESAPMIEDFPKMSSDSTSIVIYDIDEDKPDKVIKTAPKIANDKVEPPVDTAPADQAVVPVMLTKATSGQNCDVFRTVQVPSPSTLPSVSTAQDSDSESVDCVIVTSIDLSDDEQGQSEEEGYGEVKTEVNEVDKSQIKRPQSTKKYPVIYVDDDVAFEQIDSDNDDEDYKQIPSKSKRGRLANPERQNEIDKEYKPKKMTAKEFEFELFRRQHLGRKPPIVVKRQEIISDSFKLIEPTAILPAGCQSSLGKPTLKKTKIVTETLQGVDGTIRVETREEPIRQPRVVRKDDKKKEETMFVICHPTAPVVNLCRPSNNT